MSERDVLRLLFISGLINLISGHQKVNDFSNNLLEEIVAQYGNNLNDILSSEAYGQLEIPKAEAFINRVAKDYELHQFQPHVNNILINREPSIRDQEYLEHSSLWGHRFLQGGAGEGTQRLKPDGSVKNVQVIKSDTVLPAYCNPPNPCPPGYTEDDGCIEDFQNSAAFSRDYQSQQQCMCDAEHMFDCPGNTEENELDALARSISNSEMASDRFDKFVDRMSNEAKVDHKVVAKKYFTKKRSSKPSTKPEKHQKIVAKKSPIYLI